MRGNGVKFGYPYGDALTPYITSQLSLSEIKKCILFSAVATVLFS
jgi:hypothetical protein